MRIGAEEQMSNKFEDFFKSFQNADEALTDIKFANALPEHVDVIKTGSYLLDDMIGCNGIPRGKITQYFGPPGSGKSLCSLIALVCAQKDDPESKQILINSEQTFNPTWAENLGVDLSRLLVIDGESAVDGKKLFTYLLGVPKEDLKHNYVGKKTEGIFDKIVNKEFNVNMIILDSVGSILPPQEHVQNVGAMGVGILSRFLTPVMRKVSLETARANVAFIMINHIKSNLDPFSNARCFSGGNAYAHFLSVNLYFESIQRKDAQIFDEKENKIGHMIRATLEKSKYGPYPKRREFSVVFDKGVIKLNEEIATLALDYNVVQQPTKMTYSYNDYKWVGYQKFADALAENTTLANEILQKVSEARENKSKPIDTTKTGDILVETEIASSEKKSKKKGAE